MARLGCPLAFDGARRLAERTVGHDLRGVGIGDNQHRVGCGRAGNAAPRRLIAAIAAAIDDDAVPPVAQLERQGAGMGLAVETGRRRFPGIDEHQTLPRLQALKPHVRRLVRRMPAGLRSGQGQIDENPVFLDRTVEQREPPVAVTEESE